MKDHTNSKIPRLFEIMNEKGIKGSDLTKTRQHTVITATESIKGGAIILINARVGGSYFVCR